MKHKIPKHVAIIMDGNGRWARNRGLPRVEGHRAGVESVKKIVHHCILKNIKCLSLFAFSSENWARPTEEVNFLMELFLQFLHKELPEINQQGISIRFTGDRSMLSTLLQEKMNESETLTTDNRQLILNVVVNYGGKWDIVNTTKKIVHAVIGGQLAIEDINETIFADYLATANLQDPDLFIRTSGELRLSNFFLWQLAYTELYFSNVHWPDFDEHEFDLALNSFNKRERRFGQIA